MELILSSRVFRSALLVLTLCNAPAAELPVAPSASPQSLAFARYIASIQQRNPFTESEPVLVQIDASLPGLYKQSRLLLIGHSGESERREYRVLGNDGDAAVTQELIVRYFALQQELENLPLASIAITPANYRFRYLSEAGGSRPAYVFQITPKQKRAGLIQGQLWIDRETGAAVLQSGYFVKPPSAFTGRIQVVRDIQLQAGYRITHISLETSWAGRGELKIIELPLPAQEEEHDLKSAPLAQN